MNKFLLIFDSILSVYLIYHMTKMILEFRKENDRDRDRKIVHPIDGDGKPRSFKRIADMNWDEYRHYCDTGERPLE